MMSNSRSVERVYLRDYRAPDFLISAVTLDFDLSPDDTRVRSRLSIRRHSTGHRVLRLDGEALVLEGIQLDGRLLTPEQYTIDDCSLTVHEVPDHFTLQIDNRIDPSANIKLEGLYLTGGNFCTQCEPQGFRRITYFIDRPDVLSEYTVTMRAPLLDCPVLLSNGNTVSTEVLPDGRHQATWHDPHPKPSYLFALVAGNLGFIEDQFTTASGRAVCLRVYAVERDLGQCRHALDSLMQAMRWDELRYGREYDLDRFNIVAVEDFNMGAMENKSLNVFNTRYVLALPETATDQDYQAITGVIGHEYFHNWSGNRVTCRDWFQLSLKEGFTVFRDQEFSADLGSSGVKRIEDADLVRSHQFLEDGGPMSHPVRPESYAEINNFYTLTVYIKGAEVVRMLANLLGSDVFRKGCDLYFDRHDGQAVTTEEFVAAMEQASGLNLSQFRLWYGQGGTPKLKSEGAYDSEAARYTLTISQHCPPTPDQDSKLPFHVPIATALFDRSGEPMKTILNAQGERMHEHMLSLHDTKQQFVFEGVSEQPVVSLLRRFSSPVELETDLSQDDLATLMGHDDDPFNRWDAGQRLSSTEVLRALDDNMAGRMFFLDDHFAAAFHNTLQGSFDDTSFQAYSLGLPEEAYLSKFTAVIEPDLLYKARKTVKLALARRFTEDFDNLYHRLAAEGAYRMDSVNLGRRALRNTCLSYLMALEEREFTRLASVQLRTADNMTDALAALAELARSPHPERSSALDHFFQRWKDYPLVMDKWFRVQATSDLPETLDHVLALTSHEMFQLKNPNKVYALLGAFSHTNPLHFHESQGRGYAFITEQILKLDCNNPQVAARLLSAFNLWQRYNPKRQEQMRTQLERIRSQSTLSKDIAEIIDRVLS